MEIILKQPDSIKIPIQETIEFQAFLQCATNRRAVGFLRYGHATRRQRYMTRLSKELRAYRRTGNFEHLINILNYAFLESRAPENKKFHFDPTVESATRGEMGENIA